MGCCCTNIEADVDDLYIDHSPVQTKVIKKSEIKNRQNKRSDDLKNSRINLIPENDGEKYRLEGIFLNMKVMNISRTKTLSKQ